MSAQAYPQWYVDLQRKSITEQMEADERQLKSLVEWIESIGRRRLDFERQLAELDALPIEEGTS